MVGPLKKHMDDDFYFDNFISSGHGTIASMITLGTNIPTRPGMRFLSESKYLTKSLSSSSNIPFQKKSNLHNRVMKIALP